MTAQRKNTWQFAIGGRNIRGFAHLAVFSLLLAGSEIRADEIEELRNIVETQGKQIEELRGALDAIKRQDDEPRVPDAAAAPPESQASELTPEYVDQRIEDYATAPQSRFLISGYGTALYRAVKDNEDGFGIGFNPGFHFRMSDRLHFNGELELGLMRNGQDTEAEVDFEFGQADYLATDWLTLSGGFFLTPFNAFGQRLHPTWINKLASKPPIYSSEGQLGIIPVVSQVGALASGGTTLWDDSSKVNYAVYVVNAPTLKQDTTGADTPLEFDFKSTPNMGSNVSYGGRVGFLPIPNLEIGVSYQTGTVRAQTLTPALTSSSNRRYNLVGSDFWYVFHGVELRAEYVRLSQQLQGSNNPSTQGYYVQLAYRLRNVIPNTGDWWSSFSRLEPVLRWGQIASYKPKERRQLAVGLNFWIYESVPLKFTYEFNSGGVKNDRLFIQLAYGF